MDWTIIASAGLVAAASVSLADRIAPLPDVSAVDVIDLDQERFDRLTVPVTIGEHGPFDFMIDTGAQATVLSLDLADRLGIAEREPSFLIGMASRKPVDVVRVQDLTLGNRVFDIQTAPLVEQANIGSADGILGLDSLQDQRVLLDFEGKSIAVADAETLRGNVGFEIEVKARRELGQLIITEAWLDGVRVNVLIDTGAQSSIGNLALRDRLRRSHTGTASMTDINGVEVSTNVGLARDLRIGRAQLENVPIAFIDSPTFRALDLDDKPAMVLGMSELKLFRRVAIDFKERKILFDLPKGFQDHFSGGAVINF
jgi:predicted aspartyl protease